MKYTYFYKARVLNKHGLSMADVDGFWESDLQINSARSGLIVRHDIDWTRPTSHIATELGVVIHTVLSYMRRNNIPIRKRGGMLKGTKTSSAHTTYFDWSKRDSHLTSDHNFTREYIRQIRKSLGEPASGSAEWNKKYHSA